AFAFRPIPIVSHSSQTVASAEAHESAIRTDALLGRMHNLGVLGFSCAQWRLLRELRLRAIFHPGRVVSARWGRLSDCPCCPTRPNLEPAHADLAHVAERHRRAGWCFWAPSLTSSARGGKEEDWMQNPAPKKPKAPRWSIPTGFGAAPQPSCHCVT